MLKKIIIAGTALLGAAALAPAALAGGPTVISFDNLTIGDEDKDFLEQLIELDASDIEDIRADMADARADIRDAIDEIDEAREEMKSVPGGKAILAAALLAASEVVSEATEEAFSEVRSELDSAETGLAGKAGEISAEELAETKGAIEMLREELTDVEIALAELMQAMNA